MKYLLLTFIACVLLLVVVAWRQEEVNVFADGHLACEPMPCEPFRPLEAPLLEAPPATVLAQLTPIPVPAHQASAKIQIVEPEPDNEGMRQLRQVDQKDWGIREIPQPTPVVVASAPQPIPVKPLATPEPALLQPNLYLPEGAFNEEGAQFTLIKHELQVYREPYTQAELAPFTMKEGEKVRPLTRLRNDGDFDWIRFSRDGQDWWAQAEYFIRVDPRNRTSADMKNLPVGGEAVDKDCALVPDYQPDDMTDVPGQFILDGKDIRLRREAADALKRMIEAAAREGHSLRIFSGFRDFEYQKKLYLEAIEKKGPKQNGTAAPGYSEHQLGTTIDISNLDRKMVLSGHFGETSEGRWLRDNSEKFGFRNSYTRENNDVTGYRPEPWHYRYVGVNGTPPSGTAIAKN